VGAEMELLRRRTVFPAAGFGREAAMEKLIFVCPKTDQQVDIGVASEIGTLLRIRARIVRAQCPACGETHQWPVRDAGLFRAA
jgi:predicted RNA-binding Zn-ribbon protein involved in translation (DUF1610 family)